MLERLTFRISPVDWIVAASLCLAAQVEIWAPQAMVGTGSVDGSRPVLAATAAVGTIGLAFRRGAPLLSVCLVFGAWGLQGVLTTPTDGLTGLICLTLSAYSVAAHSPPRRAAMGAGVAIAGITALTGDVADWAFVALFVSAAWAAGFALRRRQIQVGALNVRAASLERERDEAVQRERGRIARELHDVVSHHVMTTVVQAQAARAQIDDDQAVGQALTAIEEGGRAALIELRALLGLLRGDEEIADRSPQPGLDDLPALVTRTQAAGLPLSLRVDGGVYQLPVGVSLAAYRIVQEALTNVLKHADAAPAEVVIDYRQEGLRLRVSDSGTGSATVGNPTGHGLVGMQERAALYGGTVTTTSNGDRGGFQVEAWFPAEATA